MTEMVLINVSLPKDLVEEIDRASRGEENRSQFIVLACVERLQRLNEIRSIYESRNTKND